MEEQKKSIVVAINQAQSQFQVYNDMERIWTFKNEFYKDEWNKYVTVIVSDTLRESEFINKLIMCMVDQSLPAVYRDISLANPLDDGYFLLKYVKGNLDDDYSDDSDVAESNVTKKVEAGAMTCDTNRQTVRESDQLVNAEMNTLPASRGEGGSINKSSMACDRDDGVVGYSAGPALSGHENINKDQSVPLKEANESNEPNKLVNELGYSGSVVICDVNFSISTDEIESALASQRVRYSKCMRVRSRKTGEYTKYYRVFLTDRVAFVNYYRLVLK